MNTSAEKISSLIIDTIPEAVAWKDLNSVYLGCNLKFAKAAGCKTTQEIIGKTDIDLPWKEYAKQYFALEKQVIESGKAIENLIEFYHHKNNDDLWLDVSLLPIITVNDETIGLLIIYHDITEDMGIKQALHNATANLEQQVVERTQELSQAREEALQASEAKSQFLSSMSHELRTPLNAILGFTQLLQMDHEQAQGAQSADLNEILNAGKHLLQLINEVLDLAKVEAGHLSLSLEPVEIKSILQECRELAVPIAREYDISLSDFFACDENDDSGCANVYLLADRFRLKQVLLNLISNAIKYNRKQGSVVVEYRDMGHDLARIIISDTGRGIDPQHQEKVFNAFERLGAEHNEIEGTGIGLVIAKRLIEEMDGQIGFESQLGQGSQFWIELKNVANIPDLSNSSTEVTVLSNPIACKKILYIEDNLANLRMLSRAFETSPNWQLITASEPISGLEKAKDQQPDLIILDLNLATMDGYAVLDQLQQSKLTQHVPVIAMSANAMPEEIKKGMHAGFSDYITKPIDINLLFNSINQIVT